MKMRLDFRLDLFVVALLLVVISNVHFKCQLALASSTNQKQQQQQQRQIGQQTGKHGPSVDRLAAILAAKPRPSGSSATQSAASQQQHQHKQQQQAQHTNNANNTTNQQAKLSSSASDLDLSKASVSSLPPASVAAGALAAARSTAKSQGKRQAGEFVDPNRSSSSAASRRNEDPWFLDQAPLPLQPYRFNYNVKDKNGLTEQYRQETGDGKFLTGSYGYVLPDGIFRHVDYVADDRGFRAFIRTSEPGTANQNPADVVINSSPVPGVGYVSPPSSTSGLANFGASSLLLGGQQQQQQQQSWADLQQPQQPRAAWNYTTFGPSPAFSSLNNLDLKRNLDTGSGVLPRRAPGSIVGTPLRNFSSFAYPFVPPVSSSLELNHPTQSSSYLTNLSQDQSPNTVGHTTFQSLSRFGDLQRLSQPSGSGNSGGGGSSSLSTTSNLTNFNTIGDDQRFNTHLTSTTGGTKSAHERDRSSSTTSSTGSSSFQGTGNYLGGGSAHLGGAAQDRQPSSGLLFAPQPLYHHRPGLLLPSRVGPDVLLYDRPFGVHQVSGSSGDGGSNKLSYDYNHILSRGDSSTPPYLAEERAKSLAYLEQLKALSRSNIPAPALVRPDLVSNELGTLVPFGGGPIGGQSAGQQTSSGVNNELSTKTTSSSHHSEHHQEHKSTTSQVVDDLTRITLTREHKSGSSLGSGHDSGSTSTQQLPNSGEAQSSLLIPPPQPQFGNNNRDGQQRWATKGQQQQPQQQQQQLQFARLLAPYADEHQLGRRGGVKGAHEQQQQATSVSPVSGPDEPRSPSEPSSPTTTTIGASDSQSTRTTPADEIELNQTNAGTKTTPSQMGPAHGQHQVRLVRMPDNYRNSMMMNDLRSMQNALGLPQPPRLQRSSSASSPTTIDDAEQRLASGPISGPSTNLADHIVSARMSRVEALLNGAARDGAGGPISSQPVAPQQASIQRSVAVRAEKREQSSSPSELRLQEEANNKLDRASLLAMVLSKPFDNEIDDEDDQPRRSSSGGQSGSSGATQPTHHLHKQQQLSNSGSNQGNESSVFDAQRLRNSSNKARLRADKVSELEKFQQRLRTQQLLLEHVKQQQSTSDNNKASPAISTTNTLVNTLNSTPHRSQTTSPSKANTGGPTSTGVKVNEANSHVKYDEPPQENELLGSTLDEPTRSRRQNDIGETAPTNKTSLRKSSNGGEIIISSSPQLTTVTTRTPVTSEFARQLNQWPSLSAGLDRQRMSNSSSGNADSSTTSGGAPITFKAHKMDTAAPKQAAHLGSSSGQDGTVSNARRTLETPSTTTTTTANNTNTNNNGTRRDSPNTINLDFINSVTALSMDHLNPFAISSVNPAVQRSASSSANGERLSPHRLVMPGTSSVQQSQQQSEQSTGGANLLATAPARYFSSPELLAALNHHDRHDTGQRMRNLLSLEPQQFEQPANHRATTSSANSATGNPNAPYMMQPLAEQTETAAGTRSLNGLLGAKFIVAPTTASTSLMSEAANSQHKSVVPTPSPSSAGPGGESMGLIRQAATGGARSQLAARSVGLIQRDGFEIRDRAVQADNHRFYEVVSSLRQPSEQANGVNFQAFRDAQLSISANQK